MKQEQINKMIEAIEKLTQVQLMQRQMLEDYSRRIKILEDIIHGKIIMEIYQNWADFDKKLPEEDRSKDYIG